MNLKKKIVVLIIILVPLIGFAQIEKKNSIEIDVGRANFNYNLNGVFLNTRYSRVIFKYVDVLCVVSLANGSQNVYNSLANNQFHSTTAQLGFRGSLNFLKFNSLKLSTQGGITFLEKTDIVPFINGQEAVYTGFLRPSVTFSIQYSISLNEKLQLGLIYSKTFINKIGTSHKKLNTTGITIAFKI